MIPSRSVPLGALRRDARIYVVFGMVLLAIPPMVAEVRADLGISRAMLVFARCLGAAVHRHGAAGGLIIDRLGLRLSLTAGSLLIAASAVMQACAQGVVMLWLAIGIIGIGGPLVSLSAPKLVAVCRRVRRIAPRSWPLHVGSRSEACSPRPHELGAAPSSATGDGC